MVLRFSDILRDRLRSLHDAFAAAIAENDYKNRYAAVFPIKVNQQRARGRGGLPRQRGPRLRARGRQQAGAARGDGDDRRRPGAPDHLQRLQGRQLHRGRDPRDQARPLDHPGDRELLRARLHPAPRREVPGAPEDRRAREARGRGRGPLARVGRRPLQVRPVHDRDARGRRGAALARHARLPEAGALPPGLASCTTSAASRTRSTSSRWSTRSSRASARASSTSTSAAASASTTTARARTSSRRPTTRCASTRTTSSTASPASATRAACRTR